ncbi:MAG: N-formylglutamate amidohydrolase [Geminicoccaceae bacterium]
MRTAIIPLAAHVELFNPSGRAPILILCDHAGREVPPTLERLGLSDEALAQHIGWDIGAADVTRHLARLLDAPALLNNISRLVIDPNRRPGTPTSIPPISDGWVVPGNEALPMAAVVDRVVRYFLPYHRAIAHRIGAFRRAGTVPVVIAVHSFTPRMNGEDRPWQIGVLWGGDQRLARPALTTLEARSDLLIGDNQPYSGLRDFGFTVQFHAQRTRLPHVMFEIRQDEIASTAAAVRYAEIVHEALRAPLAEPGLYTLYEGLNLDRGSGLISWRHAVGSSPLGTTVPSTV